MFLLSPAKLLVVLMIALLVLGPDKLPKVAKQLGGLWGDFSKFRERLDSEVRGTFPDLPSTDTITQAVREPLTFLDSLTDDHVENGVASSGASGGAGSTDAEAGDEPTGPTLVSRKSDGLTTAQHVVEEVSTVGESRCFPPVGVVHRVESAPRFEVNDSELN